MTERPAGTEIARFLELVPTDWLLEGEAFVRYGTLVDLLGTPEGAAEAVAARAQIASDPQVAALLGRRNNDSYWGIPKDIHTWWPKKDTTFWVLGVLADFGLPRDDSGIAGACEYVLGTQLPSGGFGWAPPPTPGECFTGILTEALAGLGYTDDPRLTRTYDWLQERQRPDGGFWCKNTGQPGGPREGEPSCAFATLCVVGALSRHPTLRDDEVTRRGAEFLLKCWENRGRIRYTGHDSQIGTGWEKLKYPFTDYRILKYADVLSRLAFVRGDSRMLEVARFLMDKRDERGRFRPESVHRAWSDFDFGQKRRPSRWLTFLASRVVKRIAQDGEAPRP